MASDDNIVQEDARSPDSASPVSSLLRVSRGVALGEPLPQLLDTIARAATSVVESSQGVAVFLVDGPTGRYRIAASSQLSDEFVNAVQADILPLGRRPVGEAVRSGDIVMCEDTENDPRLTGWNELLRRVGYRSMLAIPLASTGSTVGVLCTYGGEAGPWDQQEVNLLRFFSEHASMALQTTYLLAEHTDRLMALNRLVRSLREQSHEHSNRLQALRGLLALGAIEEAEEFLQSVSKTHQEINTDVGARISNPILAGFLAAETTTLLQKDIRLEIDPASSGDPIVGLSDSQLVTVVGNLLDNACDALNNAGAHRRVVKFAILSEPGLVRIVVTDRGPGLQIPIDQALEHGATTKSGHVGAGLSLVQDTADAVGGRVEIKTDRMGTAVSVLIPAPDGKRP